MLRYLVHARAARKSPDSDVDIMIGVDPTVRIGVYEYVAIKDYIAGLFDTRIDVVRCDRLKPYVRPAAVGDAIYDPASTRRWLNDIRSQIELVQRFLGDRQPYPPAFCHVARQVDEVVFPDDKRLIVLAKGRLVNPGCAIGHPSFVMSASFTNQVLAQVELFTNHGKYENKVYLLPKQLDEKVAALHLDKLGVKLTALSAAQSNYLNLPRSGPFKPEYYRY